MKHHTLRVLHNAKPSSLLERRQKRRTFQFFAEQNGFVYFGFVDQAADEHGVIRGLTSASHQLDNHYIVGSQNGYNIALIERKMTTGTGTTQHIWTVIDVTLRKSHDFPHIFIGTAHHDEHFYAHLFLKFRSMRQVPLGTFEQYSPAFTDHYSIFTTPSSFIETEQVLPARLATVIGSHFRPLAIEIANNHLYVYADNQKVTNALLQTMLQNGLWLAEELDKSAS